MNAKAEKIADHFVQLLPLVYNRLNKPLTKNSSVPKQSNLTHLQQHILEELFHTGEGISITMLGAENLYMRINLNRANTVTS